MSDEKSPTAESERLLKKKVEAGLRSTIARNPEDEAALERLCILLLSDGRESEAEKYGKNLIAVRASERKSWSRLRSELKLKLTKPQPSRVESEWIEAAASGPALPSRTEKEPQPNGVTSSRKSKGKDYERKSLGDTWPGLSRPVEGTGASVSEPEKVRAASGTDDPSVGDLGPSKPMSLDVASVLLKTGRAAEAMEVLYRLLEREPGNVDGLKGLAQALRAQGKHVESIEVLKEALAKAPNDPVLLYWFGDSKFEAGVDIQGARVSLYRSVHINADNVAAWIKIGRCHLKERAYVDATRALLRAIRIDHNNTEALIHFALALAAQEQNDRAHSVLLKVVSIEDSDPRILEAAALQFKALGKHSDANRARQKAGQLIESRRGSARGS